MPFEARDLPTAIWFQDEPVVGPFCRHCGYPFTMHSSDGLLCPATPNPFMGPICDCHRIEVVGVTSMVPDPAYVGRARRKRVTRNAQRIVKV